MRASALTAWMVVWIVSVQREWWCIVVEGSDPTMTKTINEEYFLREDTTPQFLSFPSKSGVFSKDGNVPTISVNGTAYDLDFLSSSNLRPVEVFVPGARVWHDGVETVWPLPTTFVSEQWLVTFFSPQNIKATLWEHGVDLIQMGDKFLVIDPTMTDREKLNRRFRYGDEVALGLETPSHESISMFPSSISVLFASKSTSPNSMNTNSSLTNVASEASFTTTAVPSSMLSPSSFSLKQSNFTYSSESVLPTSALSNSSLAAKLTSPSNMATRSPFSKSSSTTHNALESSSTSKTLLQSSIIMAPSSTPNSDADSTESESASLEPTLSPSSTVLNLTDSPFSSLTSSPSSIASKSEQRTFRDHLFGRPISIDFTSSLLFDRRPGPYRSLQNIQQDYIHPEDDDYIGGEISSLGEGRQPDICCPSGQFLFHLKLKTDRYGQETSWVLYSGKNKVVSGSGYGNDSEFDHVGCYPSSSKTFDGCYRFVITDSHGDGMCCSYGNGWYILEIDGVAIEHSGQFLFEESTEFCAPCPVRRRMEIALAYDSSFCAAHGGASQADAEALRIIASVSQKFAQVCTSLRIVHLEGYCAANDDPYKAMVELNRSGCGGTNGLLQAFSDYWRQFRRGVKRDTAHFLSGTGLECDGDDCIIGCAYIDATCGNSAYGVSYATYTPQSSLRDVLVAHELGHNCAGEHVLEEEMIMYPNIGYALGGFSCDSDLLFRQHFRGRGICVEPEECAEDSQCDDDDECTIDTCDLAQAICVYIASSDQGCVPTPFPTGKPTEKPTDRPTAHPTTSPPTPYPSNAPSPHLSSKPSKQPTVMVSDTPSKQHSVEPTSFPSLHPTSQPTAPPSLGPLSQPSMQPSSQPSMQPTLSKMPSTRPSFLPTKIPTSKPSLLPSFQPTVPPTNTPSLVPSQSPSLLPTTSIQPSSLPTSVPSQEPSLSMLPSAHPSPQPTLSSKPSTFPSNTPSTIPSQLPTQVPSPSPSAQPSLSVFPSVPPSHQPSVQPTTSTQPSSFPTKMPTISPSSVPTSDDLMARYVGEVMTAIQSILNSLCIIGNSLLKLFLLIVSSIVVFFTD